MPWPGGWGARGHPYGIVSPGGYGWHIEPGVPACEGCYNTWRTWSRRSLCVAVRENQNTGTVKYCVHVLKGDIEWINGVLYLVPMFYVDYVPL